MFKRFFATSAPIRTVKILTCHRSFATQNVLIPLMKIVINVPIFSNEQVKKEKQLIVHHYLKDQDFYKKL